MVGCYVVGRCKTGSVRATGQVLFSKAERMLKCRENSNLCVTDWEDGQLGQEESVF